MMELIDRLKQVILFERDEHGANYDASCNIFIYGDVGLMWNINGKSFYKLGLPHIKKVMNECGVASLEGYVTRPHAKLMERALRGTATVEITRNGIMAGKPMVWVSIRLLEEEDDGFEV